MNSHSLNSHTPHKTQTTLHKTYTLLHLLNISSLIFYRLTTFTTTTKLLPCLLLFTSEIFLSFYSLLSLSYGWRHVTRTAFPERLPEDDKLPPIDVFIFTSDPTKEPALDVMNTVISAMTLDYPSEKVNVYVSDDGGYNGNLVGVKECVEFARFWVPFCRKFKVKSICPKVFFGDFGSDGDFEYLKARNVIEEKYSEFKDRLQNAQDEAQTTLDGPTANPDHSPVIQIIENGSKDGVDSNETSKVELPTLVYVAREKRPQHPHHFKAGAINALLRVSGIISNSPYILILDSDFFCNDPSSARKSMCFHLDQNISASLAFVQFPQKFHNINVSNDIYDGRIRHVFEVKWPRMGGLEGPILSGTCFYAKREALYGDIRPREYDLHQLKQYYGVSNDFIKSLQGSNSHGISNMSSTQLSEAKFLASSTYEQNTKWGKVVGFLYASVVEDYFTGFNMHCRGWKSVLCNPERPAFLGTATINLNDALIQITRWHTGFLDVTFSRFFPLYYGLFVKKMSLLQSMCYAYFAIQPLCCLPFWCFAVVPQLCLLLGIPLYPKATSPWFMVFSLTFVSPLSKNLIDALITKSSTKTWWNEERFGFIKGVTSSLYATLDCTLKKIGLKQSSFTTTNKVNDKEIIELYNKGVFDFRISNKFIIPLCGIVIINLICFIVGVFRMVVLGQWSDFLGQICLSFFVILLGCPIIEGMVFRDDNASIPTCVSLKSIIFVLGVLAIGSLFLCV
ncbi:hypothetical protein RND81_11G136900 [Saponaria officinalis]|uniref:Uncharacterized protein n=1 Tax=Saponaria officinalis TaxID=3572 RepID=A0AAW1HLS9_SAPOF